ncbi:MAG TPA: transglycosylase SLT domain-containing protein [Chitinispirillaceae bacterium]|nr:transglycosylase SLT domain-containing protein [Chitinispirillaceae bacterium]
MNSNQSYYIKFLNTEIAGTKIELVNKCTTIGRHPSCTIQLGGNDLRVSNRHASIFIDDHTINIEDLGSTNHVYVNNVQITKTELKHNDNVRFGSNGPQFCIIIDTNQETKTEPLQNSEPQSNQKCYITQNQETGVSDIQNNNLLFDVSPDTVKSVHSPSSIKNELLKAPKKDTATDVEPEQQPERSDDHSLFDVSPDSENNNLHISTSQPVHSEIVKPEFNPQPVSSYTSTEQSDNKLFDISPESDTADSTTPFQISNTMEISARLKNQMINTQDIDHLVKHPKTRIKILNDNNIGEQQKQIITSVTKAYSSMQRKYFIFFGLIIVLLCTGIIWFAHGYFDYKSQFIQARSLKDQIASFDDQIEKARQQDGQNSNLETLYSRLQKVQAQFDSVKAKLELKDQSKIYSDTVEVFLEAVMNELNEKNYSIPQHMLERVKYYINLFTTSKRRSTEILMQRRQRYFPEIEEMFSQKNVPVILAYVAMQESMLDTIITSSAGAAGMWQFMESTGRRFNLIVNNSTDERLDWKKSTVAAANYFRSLLLMFGDGRGVLLAIAAYNAGEEKIKKALNNVENPIRDRDFWYLYRTSSILAVETREYVPQVLARIIIDRHPDLYGF